MRKIEVRFNVRLISAQALAQYMQHRGLTVRTLAEKVGCSHSTIGHLRSGKSTYIRPEWARAIEKHLDAPKGSLFVPELSSVTREAGPKSRMSA